MSQSQRPTEEQIAAAQLRIVLDEKLGRETPDMVRRIAAEKTGETIDGPSETQIPLATPVSGGDFDNAEFAISMHAAAFRKAAAAYGRFDFDGEETLVGTESYEDLATPAVVFVEYLRSSPQKASPPAQIGSAEDKFGISGDPVVAYAALLSEKQRLLGADHPETLLTRREIAIQQARTGDFEGAIATANQLITDMERVLGRNHKTVVILRAALTTWQAEVHR